MLSIAKIEANRQNALKSSGPKTDAGLAHSSRNALRHGLSATSTIVIEGIEDATEYEHLVSEVTADLGARGTVETLLCERIAQLFWRLARVTRYEARRLAQWHWDILPSVAHLDETLRCQQQRRRAARALGNLFLPEDHELDCEAASLIFSAFTEYLRSARDDVCCESACELVAELARETSESKATPTVGRILAFVRAAEDRLRANGLPTPRHAPIYPETTPNLIARVYEYHLDVNRQWDRVGESATSGFERERTNALLLQLSAAGIVDRYEPRLRRDLSRTLKDLQDLQERRRICLRPPD